MAFEPTRRGGRRGDTQAAIRRAIAVASPGEHTAREAARVVGRSLALGLDGFWGQMSPGQPLVDVVDMFSGCGGMSAGFVATRALLPSYRLVAAMDVDPVANATFDANLGVTPTCVSV